jgi:hypothetical protein
LQFDAEHIGHFRVAHGRGPVACGLLYGLGRGSLADEVGRIDTPQDKEQFGARIESSAHPIERGRDMFAQVRPIRAGAIKVDLPRRREEPTLLPSDNLHDGRGKLALEQFDQRIDLAGAEKPRPWHRWTGRLSSIPPTNLREPTGKLLKQ